MMREPVPTGVSGNLVMFSDGYVLDVGEQAAREMRAFFQGQMPPVALKWCQKKRQHLQDEAGRQKFGIVWYESYRAARAEAGK